MKDGIAWAVLGILAVLVLYNAYSCSSESVYKSGFSLQLPNDEITSVFSLRFKFCNCESED